MAGAKAMESRLTRKKLGHNGLKQVGLDSAQADQSAIYNLLTTATDLTVRVLVTMKTNPLIFVKVMAVGMALAALSSAIPLRAEFTVHEWGTFTVLHGSDGQPIRWYQPFQDLSSLPEFVHTGMFGKGGPDIQGFTARMETPVLYFYPEKEMNISVQAWLNGGALTEWFPNALRPTVMIPGNSPSLQWIGRLIPPNSILATQIPRTSDAAGRHYEAARAVPAAWLFQSNLPQPPPRPTASGASQPAVPQLDRLIFYRGGANVGLPVTLSTLDDRSFNLTGSREQLVKTFFAVQTSPQGIAWTRLEGWDTPKDDRMPPTKTFNFPEVTARETAVPALRKTLVETLTKEGLSPEEAAAMVETWHDLWFGETGTRVLAILPDSWIAQTIPLSIEPTPAHLKRVYVARLEILTKARENGLLELLADQSSPKEAVPRLNALALGRFTAGAVERVQQLQTNNNRVRLAQITAAQRAEEKVAPATAQASAAERALVSPAP